jgi:hypothetical protein
MPGGPVPAIPPDPEDPRLLDGIVHLSAAWGALVLRDGAAFVAMPDATDDVFLATLAPVYVRSIYVDALLLGVLQERALNSFANRLALLDSRHARAAEIPALETELTQFRNVLWWQHITTQGPGNEIIMRYQAQHRLPALLEQIVWEFSDYSRQVESASNVRTGAALGLITLVGLPLTLALTGDPVLSLEGGLRLFAVIIFGFAMAAIILLIPASRELVRSLGEGRHATRQSSRRRLFKR